MSRRRKLSNPATESPDDERLALVLNRTRGEGPHSHDGRPSVEPSDGKAGQVVVSRVPGRGGLTVAKRGRSYRMVIRFDSVGHRRPSRGNRWHYARVTAPYV